MYIFDFQALKCAFLIGPVLWDVCLWLADEDESLQHTLAELKVSLCDPGALSQMSLIHQICQANWEELPRRCLSAPDPANGLPETDKTDLRECVLQSLHIYVIWMIRSVGRFAMWTVAHNSSDPNRAQKILFWWLMWVEIIDSFSQALSDARTLLTVTWRNAVCCPPAASVSVELLKTRVILSAAGERTWCFQSVSQDENTRKNKHLSAEVGQCVFNVVLMRSMMPWRLTDASHTHDLGWDEKLNNSGYSYN